MFRGLESLYTGNLTDSITQRGKLVTSWDDDAVQKIECALSSADKDILAAWVVSPDSRYQEALLAIAERLRRIQPITEKTKLYRGIGSSPKTQDLMGLAESDGLRGIRLSDGVSIGDGAAYLNERPLSFSRSLDIAKTYGPLVVSLAIDADVAEQTPDLCLLSMTPEVCLVTQRYTSPFDDCYCADEVVLLTTGREQYYRLEAYTP